MFFNMVKHPAKLLKKPRLFFDFYIKQPARFLRFKLSGTKKQTGKINGRKIYSMEEANRQIFEGLMSDKPFAVTRNGCTESNRVFESMLIDIGAAEKFDEKKMKEAKDLSGIFPPNQQTFRELTNIYKDAMGEADITVYWGHILCEPYTLRKYSPAAKLMPSRALEPFGFEKPWTRALKNKKVLVVHPFEKTIKSQYEKREKLFDNLDILPEFELVTLKAVQSLADEECGFASWTDALQFMKKEIEKLDFDIAVLGCGAYAVPLAAHIKRLGKKAIILGGVTQLLFGIKGSRWEQSRPDVIAMYNDYWVRADDSEKPDGSERTEQGAYW